MRKEKVYRGKRESGEFILSGEWERGRGENKNVIVKGGNIP